MIGYITLGTNDLPRACAFYDALFDVIGGKRMMEEDTFVAWSSEAPGRRFPSPNPTTASPPPWATG